MLTSFLMFANLSDNKFLKVGSLGQRVYTFSNFADLIANVKSPSIGIVLPDPA